MVVEIQFGRSSSMEGTHSTQVWSGRSIVFRGREEMTETYGVGVWRTIRNLWLAFRDNVRIKVGRGNKALFWKEDWTGQGSLENLFPGLFSICLNPDSKIQEVWSPQGWNLLLRRFLNDWEIEWVTDMLASIGDFPGTNLETDKLL